MNVLYLGQYRGPQNDGWSIASRKYLEALLLTGHNISAKPIYMAGHGGPISESVQEAENNVLDKVDVVIQHVLPDYIESHDCYNIGIFFTETKHLEKSPWIEKINLLDEAWVSSPGEAESLKQSGVTCKISVVPIPHKDLGEPEEFYLQEIDGKFTFYFIGEHTDRKNIMALVKAFQREFTPNEDVALFIKTSEGLKEEINEWKKYSRLKKEYIPEVIITGNRFSDRQIAGMHMAGDCFVCTSRGEAQCMPILDALYYDKPVICTDDIFVSSLLDDYVILVSSQETPVDTKSPPIPQIYTANETWFDINILELQKCMRSIYHADGLICDSKAWVTENFSCETISRKMQECLSSVI